ncbi:MAG TPA: DUF2017 family protein [Jatrophihabitantaceae bacterium]|nr:DUF2017 family protein [Jatrophihabitantaceae bacterium]
MKITKDGGGARIRLNLAESHVLEQLFLELQDVLDPDALAPSDSVRKRLYPAGYADADDAASFRELTESGLHADRSERLDLCLAEVRSGRSLRRTEMHLDGDGAERWMRVLNDLRLTLGTQLNISEDDDYELDEQDPQVHLRARYLWLTALQDALVTTVMG